MPSSGGLRKAEVLKKDQKGGWKNHEEEHLLCRLNDCPRQLSQLQGGEANADDMHDMQFSILHMMLGNCC